MCIYGIVWGGQVDQPTWIMMRHASCCVPLSTNNFRNSLGLAFYRIRKARSIKLGFCSGCFGATAERPSLKLFYGAFFWIFLRKNRPRYTSAAHFMLFFLLIPPSFLPFWALLTLLKHSSSLSAMFGYIHVPRNYPINVHMPSLGPRLSLFPEVSYGQQLKPYGVWKCIFMIWCWRFEEGVNEMRDICGVGVSVWIVKIVVGYSNPTHRYFLPCLFMTAEFFCLWAFGGGTLSFLGTLVLVSLDILIFTSFPPFKKIKGISLSSKGCKELFLVVAEVGAYILFVNLHVTVLGLVQGNLGQSIVPGSLLLIHNDHKVCIGGVFHCFLKEILFHALKRSWTWTMFKY